MADPLTLSVMSQIVSKAVGKDPRPEATSETAPIGRSHLTERQAVLLSELIHKKTPAPGTVNPVKASQRTEGVMSLDALVRNVKTR